MGIAGSAWTVGGMLNCGSGGGAAGDRLVGICFLLKIVSTLVSKVKP